MFRFGNKYYENLEEQPGRHRWIDYAAHDYNTVQVEPQWHSWLHHIRQDPPNVDPIVQAAHKTWGAVSIISLKRTKRFGSIFDGLLEFSVAVPIC